MKSNTLSATIVLISLFFSGCNKAPEKEPYLSKVKYPKNQELRNFQCNKYDFIPKFTYGVSDNERYCACVIGFYSNPTKSDFEELCGCMDKKTTEEWIKETGRKLEHNEEITNTIHKGWFPSKISDKVFRCKTDNN